MSITSKDISKKLFRILTAAVLTYFGIQRAIGEMVARKYTEAFEQFKYPANTAPVDSLRISFSYYPTTYVDDSIKPHCSDLIGEVRTYLDNWNTLDSFHASSTFHVNNAELKINLMPLKVADNAPNFLLDETKDYHPPSPSKLDIFDQLQHHYSSSRISQQLKSDDHY